MSDEQVYLEKYTSQISSLRDVLPESLKSLKDDLLLRALFSREFQLNPAIELLTRYLDGRKEFPFFFPLQTPSPHYRPELFDIGAIGYASKARTSKGHHILFCDWALWEPSKIDASSMFYTMGILAGSMAYQWESNEAGFIMLSDVGNIGMKHVTAVMGSPKVMHGSMTISACVAPANVAAFVQMNTNLYFDIIWKAAKRLSPQRMQERMTLVKKKDDATLRDLLSPEVVANKSYIPTQEDRQLSRKMADQWEKRSVQEFNQVMI